MSKKSARKKKRIKHSRKKKKSRSRNFHMMRISPPGWSAADKDEFHNMSLEELLFVDSHFQDLVIRPDLHELQRDLSARKRWLRMEIVRRQGTIFSNPQGW